MSKRVKDDRRRCAYCDRLTRAPKNQPYEPSGPHEARWPHAPRRVAVPPLCAPETAVLVAQRFLEELREA